MKSIYYSPISQSLVLVYLQKEKIVVEYEHGSVLSGYSLFLIGAGYELVGFLHE